MPMAYYPIKAAKGCPEIDKIYISTDDDRLIQLGEENGLEVIKRPAHLCTDEALGEDVYVHAYNFIKDRNKDKGIDIEVSQERFKFLIRKIIIFDGQLILRSSLIRYVIRGIGDDKIDQLSF